MRTLILLFLLCASLPACYARAGKGNTHLSSIYINTPDSSVKASVTDQPGKSIQTGRIYHWYASNQLCVTNGAYSGRLLHGAYSSFYPNHFLLAQGQFCTGLKDGCWKRWLPDGSLHEVIHYKKGQLHGTYEIYSPTGNLMQRIYYRKGARAGKTTIFSQDGKDSVIVYKKGIPKESGDRRRVTGVKKRGRDSTKATDAKRDTGVKQNSIKNDSAKDGGARRETGVKKNDGDSVKKSGDRRSAAEKKNNADDSVKNPGDNRRETRAKKSKEKKDSVRATGRPVKNNDSGADTTKRRKGILSGNKIFSKKDSANIPTSTPEKNKPLKGHSRLQTSNSDFQ